MDTEIRAIQDAFAALETRFKQCDGSGVSPLQILFVSRQGEGESATLALPAGRWQCWKCIAGAELRPTPTRDQTAIDDTWFHWLAARPAEMDPEQETVLDRWLVTVESAGAELAAWFRLAGEAKHLPRRPLLLWLDQICRAAENGMPASIERYGDHGYLIKDAVFTSQRFAGWLARTVCAVHSPLIPCKAESKERTPPAKTIEDWERETPGLDTQSVEWVAARQENAKKLGMSIKTLRDYRGRSHGGRTLPGDMFGIDRDGRRWRRQGTSRSTVYYYVPSLPKTA
ncbi:hypothetical protein N9D23_05175 [Rubripirellula sp.]|nr:hypothetical protein [Rubripirellula sp.]